RNCVTSMCQRRRKAASPTASRKSGWLRAAAHIVPSGVPDGADTASARPSFMYRSLELPVRKVEMRAAQRSRELAQLPRDAAQQRHDEIDEHAQTVGEIERACAARPLIDHKGPPQRAEFRCKVAQELLAVIVGPAYR